MGKNPNRLIHEKSPYLLQHAYNPVDWHSWGEEAFKAAEKLNRPILLSIGYATCHWCHIMESESFENEEIAKLLNETFINIKVDREELPEVDALYMDFAQGMMEGQGGWPLNVILTPDLKPFFAFTYLPPESQHGLAGFKDVILRIGEAWQDPEERGKINEQTDTMVRIFSENLPIKGSEFPSSSELHRASELLYKLADPTYGGTKGSPKFPLGYQWNFVLRYGFGTDDSRGFFVAKRTLEMMWRGGIYDHLGGGFSRYAVDERWHTPHFEKMLYDNALLVFSYLEGWQALKEPLYQTVCLETCDYILREMTHPEGGFYSAQDADSEGKEGYFYTWPIDELQKVLGEDAPLFCEYFGVTDFPSLEGRHVLQVPFELAEFAEKKKIPPVEFQKIMNRCKEKLFAIRKNRIPPFKDDKIVTAWNGLMIAAFAEASQAFDKENYLQAAAQAASFIQRNLWKEKTLYRRWREGEHFSPGTLEDYAFLIRGLISLFEAGGDPDWLLFAKELIDILGSRFKEQEGAFYQTNGEKAPLILRRCPLSDGAEPSGNGVHAENLIRWHQVSQEDDALNDAEDILKTVKPLMGGFPLGYCYHLLALHRYYDLNRPTFVIALNEKGEYQKELQQLLYQNFIPHKAILWNDPKLHSLLPFLKEQMPMDGKTTLYTCLQGVCKEPTTDFSKMQELIIQSAKGTSEKV